MPDIILRNGTLYDGLGNPPYQGDIAITNGRITAITSSTAARGVGGGSEFDLTGLAVSPGFIDIHTHSDFGILDNPLMLSSLTQGVTTEVVGNCGVSVALITPDPVFSMETRWVGRGGRTVTWNSVAEWLSTVEENGVGLNVCTLAGHGSIRKQVLGMDHRAPDRAELVRMCRILESAMDYGAMGISTGLEYIPGMYAGLDEQIELVKVAAKSGGFYATHLRNEGDTLIESVDEAIEIARQARAPLQLSHHKAEGRHNWHKIDITLGMMDNARLQGMDVLTDQYPYPAFMTGLTVIIMPGWATEGTTEDMLERLRIPSIRTRIVDEINQRDIDWTTLRVGIARKRPSIQGMTLAGLAALDNTTPAEAALDLILEEDGWVSAVNFSMSEANIKQIYAYPHTMVGSDGVAHDPTGPQANDNTHPRSYGTFPRTIARYVREEGVFTLSEAIRRMTSLPATRLRFTDRGVLVVGNIADVTVFDPAVLADRATFDQPHQYATGIVHVLVNGRFAIQNGQPLNVRHGKVLRRYTPNPFQGICLEP